jgi:hypothetical protein
MGPTTEPSAARRINFLPAKQDYLTLAAAASIVLKEARKAIPPVKFPDDPGDASRIAAGALARLVGIYAFDRARGCHTPVAPHVIEGCSTIASLSVRRSDLASALLLIRRSGLPFILALSQRRKAPNDAPES